MCWHHTDFSLEIHLSPCQPRSLCCMGPGSPDVFKLVTIISYPLGHGVCLSLGHVVLKREPWGFPWLCQTVVSTSAYKGRNSAECRGQSYYHPKDTDSSRKQSVRQREEMERTRWLWWLPITLATSVYFGYVTSKFLLLLKSFWVGFFLLAVQMNPTDPQWLDYISKSFVINFLIGRWELERKISTMANCLDSESLPGRPLKSFVEPDFSFALNWRRRVYTLAVCFNLKCVCE